MALAQGSRELIWWPFLPRYLLPGIQCLGYRLLVDKNLTDLSRASYDRNS